ncbi:hypothetical protein F7725_002506 [Dissostichus mawsoni]|uniref:Regulator of cell cycle n=1 Tax=Dissostichus mawsoni TaxID=36200 RepID=A0A7J5Y4S0_DISMA|nr:hypothetical protein F7725_002506 [Dissostichus mawsoni]
MITGIMKSPKLKPQAKLLHEDLTDVLCEFDAVMEDFTSPVEKRHFRYDEHLKTMKRRSSASVSDSGISDSESAESLNRNSFSFSDERLNSPTTNSPPLMHVTPRITSFGPPMEQLTPPPPITGNRPAGWDKVSPPRHQV